MDTVQHTLEATRRELLDLGLRNPLLNYRTFRARGVEMVNEPPVDVYRQVVENGRSHTFLSQPITSSYVARSLQTPYSETELQKRLFTTYNVARDYLEEQGVNVLYLALGMLHWRENGNGRTDRRAPLILIPVELTRNTATDQFRLRCTGGDIGDNLPLRTRFAQEFSLALPQLPEEESVDVAAYFAAVAGAVAPFADWRVDDTAVTLAFFSFSKYLMVHDLDPVNWPPQAQPTAHKILRALLTPAGFTESPSALDDDTAIDAHIQLEQSHQVVDADSSQTLAILDVQQGRNLVIQGPPGTGKSQTIANLIAEALGRGQTVLFVAEKMAALDVVKRRLDEVGLGDACLELHSHKATKRTFLQELARTVQLGQPKDDGRFFKNGRFPHLSALQTSRDHLNAYSRALNTPIGHSETTLYDAYGRLLRLQTLLADADPPQLDLLPLRQWSAAEFAGRQALIAEFQSLLAQMGPPTQHPFWGSPHASVPPEFIPRLRQLAAFAQDMLAELQTAVHTLATPLQLEPAADPPALNWQRYAAQRLAQAPNLRGIDTASPLWHELGQSLLAALEAGQQIREAHTAHDDLLIPEAWVQEVFAARQGLMAGRSPLRRLFSGRYRQARERLAGLCRTAPPDSWAEQLAAIDAILAGQRAQPVLAEMTPHLQTLFGVRWRGADCDWPELLRAAHWLVQAHDDARREVMPAAALSVAAHDFDRAGLGTAVAHLDETRRGYETAVTALLDHLQLDQAAHFGPHHTLLELPFAAQSRFLDRAHAAANRFGDIVAYNLMAKRLHEAGLAQFLPLANEWPAAPAHLGHLLQQGWLTSLIAKAQAEHPALKGLHGAPPSATAAQFGELDTQFLAYNRTRLAREHWQRLPRYSAAGQMGLLQAQMDKKRNHLPIRQLMEQAGYAVQRIKPVFMMSPLSIATYLPPASVQFDLVIFDEASQVRPVDAFGAILRGKQVVVVGDSRQLPPSSFFETLLASENGSQMDAEDADAESASINLIAQQESILDLFCAQNAPQRMLRWHYRSRHESLIAVSNEAFYERRLVIFPGPDAARQETGLRYHHLPHTAYDRGRSRTNPLEGQAVAQAVLAHARTQPHLTLGAVAFSTSQQQAIRQAVEDLRRQHPETEPFFRAHPTEPFFVKNLENVQGDERDVILISVGYGRSADGNLTMNFGPLNQAGGERRLNVLITRARRRCEIFTNLTAADIDLGRTEAAGVVALQTYLHFAQTGQMADRPPETAAHPAPFEDVLAEELRQQGYTVAQRVGTGPVRVDLAILGADGRYTLGIECDGDNYHLARSARDRDRIQGQVLRRLGWRMTRVWSQQWQQNPAAERAQLLADAINPPQTEPILQPPLYERYDPRDKLAEDRPIQPYKLTDLQIDMGSYSFSQYYSSPRVQNRLNLLGWVTAVVEQEGPIHRDEAMRRLSHAAGYQMKTVPEDVERWLIKQGQKSGHLVVRGDFLWPVDMAIPPVRDRSQLPPVSRKFEYIAPEEMAEAALLVVRDALGIPFADVPHQVGRLFGFRQIGESSKEGVDTAVDQLLAQGRVWQYEGQLFPVER
ncbi:MAG: DUF3320 domain-containing protein [Ardenticatenaceae bacterium]|nr:DUF3320 domain-containing protein [Ardenticatenaceae bacterium]